MEDPRNISWERMNDFYEVRLGLIEGVDLNLAQIRDD